MKSIEERLAYMTDEELESSWNAVNTSIGGYPIGRLNDTPRRALKREGFVVFRAFTAHSGLPGALGVKHGTVMAVMDVNGPWAVEMT